MGEIFISDVKASVGWSRHSMMMQVLRTEALPIFLILLGVNLNFCLKIPAFSFKVKGWRVKSIRRVQRAHICSIEGYSLKLLCNIVPNIPLARILVLWNSDKENFCVCAQRGEQMLVDSQLSLLLYHWWKH